MRIIPNSPAALALASLVFIAGAWAQTTTGKPNVLWIISDDLDMDVGCYGDKSARTPHIDALAAQGVRFDRAYAQYTLCNPSRTSFLSGKRPDTTRIWDNETEPRAFLGQDYVFLPEYFRAQGYYTGAAGKIAHFAGSLKWDSYLGTKGEKDTLVQPAQMIHSMAWQASGLPDSEMQDGKTARRVGELMKVKRAKPFFLAAGFHKPHTPCVAPKAYFDLHPLDKIILRPQRADDLLDIPRPAFFLRESLLTEDQWRHVLQARAAAVSFMDAQVGYLMHLLDSLDLRKNTVVVFQSDHGFLLGEHQGGCYKTTLFEPTARVPLIVSMPGKAKGKSSEGFVELVDLYPTLADLCGLPPPPEMEGTSFAPLLNAPAKAWKSAAFTQVYRVPHADPFTPSEITVPFMAYAMRTDRYRFMDWQAFGREAYDEDRDPEEWDNLVFGSANPRLSDSLATMLQAGWKAALPGKPVALRPEPGQRNTRIDGGSRASFASGHWRYRLGPAREIDLAGKVRSAQAQAPQ